MMDSAQERIHSTEASVTTIVPFPTLGYDVLCQLPIQDVDHLNDFWYLWQYFFYFLFKSGPLS